MYAIGEDAKRATNLLTTERPPLEFLLDHGGGHDGLW